MFAKLKKKVLEEGEAGGPERLAFSPRKLPGGAVAVRSPPGDGNSPSLGGHEGGGGDGEGQGGEKVKETKAETVEVKPLPLQSIDLHPTTLPSHLQSSLTQETVHHELLRRIAQQQQELGVLSQQLREVERGHEEERGKWQEMMASRVADKDSELQVLQSRFDKVDGEATELKLQVVELQLERDGTEQRLAGETARLQERLGEVEREREEGEKTWSRKTEELENKVTELEDLLSDKDFHIVELEDRVSTLETSKMEALGNLVEVSQDEVLHRLQNEVIDLEKRLRSKTMEIEITRTNAEAQIKWKEQQLQEGVTRQESLLVSRKELESQVTEKRAELQELRQELERERTEGGKKEREVGRLAGELDEASKRVEELEHQVEELESSHARHLQEMAAQRDARVGELSKALEELRGDILGSETVTSPERNPLDFATVATQTDNPAAERENSVPAVLPVNSCPETSINGLGYSDGEEGEGDGEGRRGVDMQSHGLIEELQLLRQEQLRLQEEVAEKNKLVRFQQLKIIDMKKALNKELRSQSSQDLMNPIPPASVISSPPNYPWQRGRENSPTPPPPGTKITGCEDVNFQYLKHVVIKFLCSREDEATQLIRAVSTLLDFTPQEEQFVKEYFDYKLSWFGSMPQPLYNPARKLTSFRQTN